MKTLYLVRHAKSSWDEPGLDDFNRPLNDRGKRDAPRMGKRMRKNGLQPDLICASPAMRAWHTALAIAEELGYKSGSILSDKKLYHAGEESLLEFVRGLPDKHGCVMIVSHNPGLTGFADELANEDIGNISTAGIVTIRMKIDSWKDADWGIGKMIDYDYPKKA